jgi:hypothetical protein
MVWMTDSCFRVRVCAVRVLVIVEGNVLKLFVQFTKQMCMHRRTSRLHKHCFVFLPQISFVSALCKEGTHFLMSDILFLSILSFFYGEADGGSDM